MHTQRHDYTYNMMSPRGAGKSSVCVGWAEGGCWALQKLQVGLLRVSDLQPHDPRDGGCCVATPPGCRVRAPETTGALPSNVTNTIWHVAACLKTLPPFTHTGTQFFSPSASFSGTQTPTQTGTDTWIEKTKQQPVAFSISLTKADAGTQRQSNPERQLLTLAWTRTHTSVYTPPVAVIRSSHSALHYVKVTACFYSPWSQSSLFLLLTPPLLCGAFQSFRVIPPLRHLSCHLKVKCICRPSQIGCHIYFKGVSKHTETGRTHIYQGAIRAVLSCCGSLEVIFRSWIRYFLNALTLTQKINVYLWCS